MKSIHWKWQLWKWPPKFIFRSSSTHRSPISMKLRRCRPKAAITFCRCRWRMGAISSASHFAQDVHDDGSFAYLKKKYTLNHTIRSHGATKAVLSIVPWTTPTCLWHASPPSGKCFLWTPGHIQRLLGWFFFFHSSVFYHIAHISCNLLCPLVLSLYWKVKLSSCCSWKLDVCICFILTSLAPLARKYETTFAVAQTGKYSQYVKSCILVFWVKI